MKNYFIEQFLIGDYQNFTYLIGEEGGEAYVVDPQPHLKPWQVRMQKRKCQLAGVLLTHTHWDHVAGLPEIAREYGSTIPVYAHAADAARILDNLSKLKLELRELSDGQKLFFDIEAWHTPGHSPGEICYLWRHKDRPFELLTGDTVFVGMVGRTDLDGGSDRELFETLQRLKTLPPDTIIYPGHDYGRTRTTTIGRECAESTAFQCTTVQELADVP